MYTLVYGALNDNSGVTLLWYGGSDMSLIYQVFLSKKKKKSDHSPYILPIIWGHFGQIFTLENVRTFFQGSCPFHDENDFTLIKFVPIEHKILKG